MCRHTVSVLPSPVGHVLVMNTVMELSASLSDAPWTWSYISSHWSLSSIPSILTLHPHSLMLFFFLLNLPLLPCGGSFLGIFNIFLSHRCFLCLSKQMFSAINSVTLSLREKNLIFVFLSLPSLPILKQRHVRSCFWFRMGYALVAHLLLMLECFSLELNSIRILDPEDFSLYL